MVDVSAKPIMLREATARGEIRLQRATLKLIESNAIAKDNVESEWVSEKASEWAGATADAVFLPTHPLTHSLTHHPLSGFPARWLRLGCWRCKLMRVS